jgi:hypothetical protein
MTPLTGATFPTAMRRSAPCFGAERLERRLDGSEAGLDAQRRTSILLSADGGWVLRAPLRPLCRRGGSVPRWRAPDHRLKAVRLGLRRSGPVLKGIGRQPPGTRPYNPRSISILVSASRLSDCPTDAPLSVGSTPSSAG